LTAFVPTPLSPTLNWEDLVVVLGAGVDARDALDDFAERDAPPVVAHGDNAIRDGDEHLFPVAHNELVDRVIDDFLEEHVDPVVIVRAIPDSPDVHAVRFRMCSREESVLILLSS